MQTFLVTTTTDGVPGTFTLTARSLADARRQGRQRAERFNREAGPFCTVAFRDVVSMADAEAAYWDSCEASARQGLGDVGCSFGYVEPAYS